MAALFMVAMAFSQAAHAAAYSFPGALPGGCSGSGTSYTCGALVLASGDTVAVTNASTTITFTSLNNNNAQFNAAGTANLTLTMTGTLTVAAGAVIKANTTAGAVSSSGAVTYVGNLTATGTGTISLGAGTNVSGALTNGTGAVTLLTGTSGTYTTVGSITSAGIVTINAYNRINGDTVGYLLSAAGNNRFGGSITATTTYVSLGGNATVDGFIKAQTYVALGGSSTVTGSITAVTSYIDTGSSSTIGGSLLAGGTYVDIHGSTTVGGSIHANSYVSMTTSSVVSGSVSANSTIALGAGSTVAKCVRAKNANTITLPAYTAVGSACCGSGSSCTSTCVSTATKPPTCSFPQSSLMAEYRFEEGSYNGTAGEAFDSSGNSMGGKMIRSSSGLAYPTSVAAGKTCRGIQIPANTTSAIQAFDTGIDINSIGNEGSITFWYKSVDTSSTTERVLLDATTVSGIEFIFYREGDAPADIRMHTTASGGTIDTEIGTSAIPEATWTHITMTWSGSAGYSRMYANGAEEGSETIDALLHANTGTLYVGDNRSSFSPYMYSANGYIDQVRIYNHALTPAQIATDMADVPSCVSLHHLELTTSSSSATPGVGTVFTIKACGDAACSTLYTGGVTGSITVTGVTPTYTTGQAFSITAGSSSTTETVSMTAGTATAALTVPSPAPSNSPATFCGMGVSAASGNSCNLTVAAAAVHHLELTATSNTSVTCNPITYTVKACSNADCSSTYTGGMTGTLSVSGVTVNYPSGAGFTIANGSDTTTVSAHATTVGTATASLTGLSITPSNTPQVFCGMGAAAASGGSCAISTVEAALLFNVNNHYSEASNDVTVSAVRSSNNATECTPAFASVSKDVTFKCTYSNPASGTKAVRVGGAALNAGNNAAAACDGTGRAVSLNFNASGVASTTVQYADVGQMGMSATYTGSGSDAGLSMTGSDSFIAAPYYFSVTGPGAGDIKAGNTFSATVTARNWADAATPNFGKETVAEGVTLGFVRTLPSGSAAVNGSFSGTVGAFNAGAASGSDLNWTEVGRGDVAATLTDAGADGYLGSGLTTAGSTAGWAVCAAEGGTCTLPAGATGYVAYGADGFYAMATGVTGSVGCTDAVFGDPIPSAAKSCLYLVTSGAAPGVAGGVGPFTPHHFDVTTINGCGTFTYGGFTTGGATTLVGQPFSVTVRARNANGDTTVNYDGSINTSPNYAKATTLSAEGGTNIHSVTNATVAASSFALGAATVATPTLLFADSKLRAATTVTIRATDTDSVTSNGYTEDTIALRSGRIKVSNAFGSEKSALQVPVQAQYWSGSAWVLNAADGCTSIPAASVARSNYLDHKGAATAAWTTTPSAVTISGGNGMLTLSAPSPAGSVGSVDFALNLGTAGTDGSCQITPRPASTAGNLPWLRAQNGSGNNCSDATYTRDPSARATFGIYNPESKKTVFTRELY